MSVSCRDFSSVPVCFTDGAGVRTTLVAHYEYRKNAAGNSVLHATRYTDAAGVPVNTAAGTVTVGACAISPPDIEWTLLCDVQPSGVVVEFWQQIITSYNASGAVIQPSVVNTFAADKVTPYVPTGTVAACSQDCDPVAPVGLLTTWG